jgi:exopolysaccharide biosynthesis polyprenyl glycosylphosphotransferase
LALVVGDFIAINLAWLLYYGVRVASGWFMLTRRDMGFGQIVAPGAVVCLYWLLIFLFYGLYRAWYQRSHFDEFSTLVKATLAGTFIVFVGSTLLDPPESRSPIPYLIVVYWGIVVVCVSLMRATLRGLQARMFRSGIGTRASLIVGRADRASELMRALRKSRPLGFDIQGFVSTDPSAIPNGEPAPLLGTVAQLEEIIRTRNIREVLVTVDSGDHETLLDVIGRAAVADARVKIMPDLYDIVSGQARIAQLHGVPLIDVSPHLMQPWEEGIKRLLDAVASLLVIAVGLPVWILVALAVVATSRGGVFYRQERMGRDGKPFRILKFRTMVANAEQGGPQWAVKNDPRVTSIGRFLRKSHLDEVPQFLNVLRGDMSIVGPRPERPFFAERFLTEIPYYRRRLKVRPGITGWYQVSTDKYDESVDDVKTRLKYDLYYIENMSLRLDVKIIIGTAFVMMRGKGQA